ncbi:TetR-like C-terminal domain-containing protein [Kitasatospora sp. NPDC018058]|uniref:TetR-like C-terminal domain-containing protein n=1 Tax=Kitasatospora sp. NPDC018058 TaxID=3364025 RepID=UPI0037BF0932
MAVGADDEEGRKALLGPHRRQLGQLPGGGAAHRPGDALLGDPEQGDAVRCSDYAAEQLKAIGVRAAGRGEAVPDVETLLDVVVAPLMYRILFRPSDLSAAYAGHLVAAALGRTTPPPIT